VMSAYAVLEARKQGKGDSNNGSIIADRDRCGWLEAVSRYRPKGMTGMIACDMG
jgi:hypothetical protein